MNVHGVPAELRERRRWVVWRSERRNGKRTKVPFQAACADRRASTTDPGTWATFNAAAGVLETGGCDGIGFVFAPDDPYAGVDLDGCVTRRGNGGEAPHMLDRFAVEIIRRLDSYTEVSPSGTGLHVIVRGRLGEGRRRGPVEVYDRGRYFCMTGERLGRLPASPMPRQTALDELVRSLRPRVDQPVTRGAQPRLLEVDDEELLRRACAARNGPQVARLWAGDWEGYRSQSEADAALCRHLAYWCANDADRVDRLFRRSGLMRPKWERDDYRVRTLDLATGAQG